MSYDAVDVLGFAGGFTLGAVQAGLKLVGKRELPGGFGVPNCLANRHLLGDDWQVQVGSAESWEPVRADVVFGNPPCSAFSVMTAKGSRGPDAKVTSCMWDFVSYAARVRPQIAVFESVQQAFRNPEGHKLMLELRAKLEELTGENWTLHHVLHNAYAVGGAAQRRRYFWVASRVPFGVEPMNLDHLPLLNDIIGDLESLPLKWNPQPYPPYGAVRASRWVERERMRSYDGTVDGHMTLDNPLTRRIGDLLTGVPWYPGESFAPVLQRHWDTYARLPDSFADTEDKIVKRDFHVGYTTPTRWKGDAEARVITGGALNLTLHPHQDRMITHREAARIMGFPDDWLISPMTTGGMKLALTWGKGITVQCGRWIGEWVRRSLDGEPGSLSGESIGDREYLVDLTHDWKHVGLRGRRQDDMVESNLTQVKQRGGENMTQPSEAAAPQVDAQATDASSEKKGRGRPRPETTIERDQKVYDLIPEAGSITREEILTKLGPDTKPSHVYLSLYRLRKAEKIVKQRDGGKHVWLRTTATAVVTSE